MKIVFWSEEAESGTTSNMIATASLIASKYAYKMLLLQAGREKRSLREHFSKPEGAYVKENCAYYAPEGLDYLFTAGKKQKLTEHHVTESLQPVVENRLYCLSRGSTGLQDYYPKATEQILNQVVELTEKMMDITFIDCGNNRDEWTKNQIKEADLVVVNFKQTPQVMDHFILNNSDISEKIIYFIGNYQKDSIYNKKNINRIYRIEPEKLGVIPYNPEFQLACDKGKVDKYMKGKGGLHQNQRHQEFFRELEAAMQTLLENVAYARKEK